MSIEKNHIKEDKLCYVVPEFKSGDHTHFAYTRDFLDELNKNFNTYLIVEKIDNPFYNFFPIRCARLFGHIAYARFCGYKNFYVHYSFLGALMASLVAKFSGGRVFYWNCGEPWKYKRNIFRETFEKTTYKLIDFLVTGAQSLAREYSRYYGISIEKIKIMPNWINIEKATSDMQQVTKDELRKKLKIGNDKKIILFVHRLSKRKGAHYLPEILKRLNSTIHNSSFVILIIGDGPERQNIESRIRNYELWDKVRFLGWVPNYQLPNYYLLPITVYLCASRLYTIT